MPVTSSAKPVEQRFDLVDAAASDALARELSLYLKPGDAVLLRGDLGAGKTHMARALIRAVAAAPGLDVPSPTFTLRQDYDTARFPIAHLDLYRVDGEDEVGELDIDGALVDGIVLVEWPGQAGETMWRRVADRLVISLDFTDGDGRSAHLIGHGTWRARLARRAAIKQFLQASGHGADMREFLQGDASPRRYERLYRATSDGQAIFMDAPPQADPGLAGQKAYSQIARLAEDMRPFAAVAEGLRARGLRAPAIYHADIDAGMMILEDLGSGQIVDSGGLPIVDRYEAAIDVLAHLHDQPLTPSIGVYRLPDYEPRTLLSEVSLVAQWYMPWRQSHQPATEVLEELTIAFEAVLEPVILDANNKSWTLRDYHSPNIIWIDQAHGLDRVALIDFQDAVFGPAAYDVASLAMDARVDIGPDLERHLYARYGEKRVGFDPRARARFDADYAIMAAQRNSKILGIFTRLAQRDGKAGYLRHQPRIADYLSRALAHPALKPVAAWYECYLPEALDPARVLP